MSKEVIVCKKGSVTKWQKEKLSKAGFIVLDVEDTKDVVLHRQDDPFPVYDLMMAALGACKDWQTAEKFAKDLHSRLANKESLKQQ